MNDGGGRTSLYLGGPIDNAAEAACLRRVRGHLEASATDAVLIANVTIGPKRRQVDLIIATATSAIIVEIKGYVHAVRGGVNGPWTLDAGNGVSKSLGTTNPYQQTLTNRYAVTDALAPETGLDANQLKSAVGGALCLFPAPPANSALPASDFKVTVGGYAELIEELGKRRSNAVPLDAWHRFAMSLGAQDETYAAPTAAEQLVSDYLAAFTDLARATSGPYIEPSFNEDNSTAVIAARITEGEQLQVSGPSGSGKSELLAQLAQTVAATGYLPIQLRAGDFEGKLGPLLQSAISRCSASRTTGLMKAAAQAGAEIILFVDGINECPATRRNDLIAALQAARINYGARLVIAGQNDTPLPDMLSGQHVRLVQPDRVQAECLVAAHLGRPLSDSEARAVEVVATAQDAAILAAILHTPGTIDGRHALYRGFTEARLEAVGRPELMQALADLATAMRRSFVAVTPLAWAEQIINGSNSMAASAAARSELIGIDGSRLAFRHDLIADFFAADDILRRARTPAELGAAARLPINAELREFLLGGCATISAIEAVIGAAPDPRLLRAALDGRAGEKARSYVVGRLRDLIGRLRNRFCHVTLALPEGTKGAKDFHSFDLSFPDEPQDEEGDAAFLQLLPFALGREQILDDLLAMFGAIDVRLAAEAERLRAEHPHIRLAWRAASYGSIYGSHFHLSGRELQDLLSAVQSSWLLEETANPALAIGERLDWFEFLSPGQLFLLVTALRRGGKEPLPTRFPDLVQHIWDLRIYHLRLFISDIIRWRGSDLADNDRQAVRHMLNGWLSDDNIFMNSIVIDALEGVDGIEVDLSVEDAAREYDAVLDLPDTADSRKLAISAVTWTYDHPFREIYWEAFYEALPVEKRQAILLRGLRDEAGDPWFVDDILRALRREPTPDAAPALQRLAFVPTLKGHSQQYAVLVYADAIALLAELDVPLAPDEPPPDTMDSRAWYCAAPFVYALNAPVSQSDMISVAATERLMACGIAEVFDVIQRLAKQVRVLRHPTKVDFERLWPDLILGLCRAVLSPDYRATSIFERLHYDRTLIDDHVDFALAMIATVGRPTDLALVSRWLQHPKHGERALATARSLERDTGSVRLQGGATL
jgi:energy-coupling factor transporter ATP-binding protein EcfA2